MTTQPTAYLDLLVTKGDLTLNVGHEPLFVSGGVSIAQDIKHAIIESGLVTRLVGERSPTLQMDILNQIELLAERDGRLIPGTVSVAQEGSGRYLLTATAYLDHAVFTFEVTIND